MRVAFFADSYKPYLSGVTNYIQILTNELRRLGHRVYIFAPGYPKHIDDDPDVYRFPSLPTAYPKFRLAIPFLRSIPEIDLVHCHSPFQAGLLGRFVARRREIPFVYSFHTLFTRYVHYARLVPAPLAKMGIVAYLQAFCRRADTVICPSELARRVLRSWRVNQPIEVVPAGIELQHLPADLTVTKRLLKKKFHLPEEAVVLLYAGRLSKEKNISFLLQAFEKLRRDHVYLVLVGGGPLEKELRQQSLKNVVLTGEVPYPEILSYYSIGDIFLFASLTETQGLVLAEAKASGLPVVALFAGGLVNSVRSGIDGYLVARNLGQFVEHVDRLIVDQAFRQKMSQAARQDALERFSAVLVAKKIESVYNSLSRQLAKRG